MSASPLPTHPAAAGDRSKTSRSPLAGAARPDGESPGKARPPAVPREHRSPFPERPAGQDNVPRSTALGDIRSDALPLRQIPPRAWPNLLSLDAPAVALLWQALFSQAHGHGWPPFSEALALGLAVWMIYVADRLLDARALEPDRPHLLRHRFHADRATAMTAALLVTAVLAAAPVALSLAPSLVAGGLCVLGVVLVYGVGVHAGGAPIPGVAKELRVGLVFALGVSLSCWWRSPSLSLLASVAMAGLLFSANCLTVSLREEEGRVGRPDGPPRKRFGPRSERVLLCLLLLLVGLGAGVGAATRVVPLPMAAALLAGGLALGVPLPTRRVRLQRLGPGGWTRFDRRGPLADAALLAPPALAFWLASQTSAGALLAAGGNP